MTSDAWGGHVSRPVSLFPSGAWSAPERSEISPWGLARRLLNPPPPTIRAWSCPTCDTSRSPRRWSRRPCSCGAELVPCKRALPAWSPWTFRGDRRSAETADRCAYLAVEYDGAGGSCDEIRARWAAWGHLGHTTWSHTDPTAARARVVVPLERTITVAEWPAVWAHARAIGAHLDTVCSDPGRLWFLSLARPGFASWHHGGPPLPVPDIVGGDPPGGACEGVTRPAGQVARFSRPDASRSAGRDASRRYPISVKWRTDAAARRDLGVALGGVVVGDVVRRVTCPHCRRASVWWRIDPRSPSDAPARCDHGKSCGWWGWLDQLARGVV